jgi:hypothetical protein
MEMGVKKCITCIGLLVFSGEIWCLLGRFVVYILCMAKVGR